MGLFDKLFPKKALRERLFDAVASKDEEGFAKLARENADEIRAEIENWQNVPDSIRDDPERLQWYGEGLISIARFFEEVLGDPSLVERLSGDPGDNPISDWQEVMAEVSKLTERLLYEDAQAKLEELEARIQGLGSGHADHMRAVTSGRIGECRLQSGDAEGALARFVASQEICEDLHDAEGVRAYLGSRLEALRWLGRHEEAVPVAERLGDLYETAGDPQSAIRFRERARVMKAGEPLARVVAEIGGIVYELDSLPDDIEGEARVVLERNRLTLTKAERFVQEGRDHGNAASYEAALALFSCAVDLDPYDPHSRYETAYTYAQKGDFQRAVEVYDEVEVLAPGWFNSRSDRWLSARIVDGDLPADVWPILIELEEGVSTPDQKLQMSKILTERFPTLPHGWLHRARWSTALGRADEALALFERGLAVAKEPDIRTRLLFELGAQDPVEHRRHLEEAVSLRGHLSATGMAAVVLHATREMDEE